MSIKQNFSTKIFIRFLLIGMILVLAACGGGSSSSNSTSSSNAGNTTNQTGTGTGALVPVPTATGNSAPLVVDAGPVSGSPSVNVAYVSVTVCPPGTTAGTAACQTIDHVSLDTGSYGLRLLNSELSSKLNLPPVTSSNGQAIGECVQFVVGSIWGSVRKADIYIGGEVAKNVSIHDIGDNPGGASSIPADCSGSGTIQDTQATLGSNGILGVGPLVNDCDICLTQAVSKAYYQCTSTGCSNSTVTASQVVTNPVASFTQDNNGVLVQLPTVSAAGSTGISGTVIFGIGTQTNNVLGSASIYPVNTSGYYVGSFTTNYKGRNLYNSYLDSGSNALFFNDASIPLCALNNWAYCPAPSPMTLSATNGIPGITVASPSPTIVNADTLFSNNNIVAGNIGGPGTSGSFAWGLPFFYGRTVFTAISGMSTSAGYGPYWAY